jgi:excinuclease ABC subunit A
MTVINKLVDKGNTILIIEHNMDVIKLADYIIDIGPEGKRWRTSRCERNSEEVAKNKKSYTAKFLKKELA